MTGSTTAVQPAAAPGLPRIDTIGHVLLLLFLVALPLSIAVSSMLLTALIAVVAGGAAAGVLRLRPPAFVVPLIAYAAWTLVTAAFSLAPAASVVESKEVLLFLVVPVVHALARGDRAWTAASVVLTVGAVTAVIGIVQYGILQYDHLGRRPSGSMGHYMTYAGLLMLTFGVAAARVLFGARDRIGALVVLPALTAALAVTLTRNAWVGAAAGAGLLLALRDRRWLAFAPVAAAVCLALAPAPVLQRVYSTFDLQDPTNRDRIAMAAAGAAMVRDHPLTGVGPAMVEVAYPDYRTAQAVNATNPHLHNNPLQIAAERGVPALGLWLWFVAAVVRDLRRRLRTPATRTLAAAGLAAVASMLAAGLFEYNFGDSEFLMLFLVLVTLPAAAGNGTGDAASDPPRPAARPRPARV